MSSPDLDAALVSGDLDELLRWVDRLCQARDWDALVRLCRRCRSSFEATGHQLWPIVSQIEYRLALEAPPSWAASVLVEGAGRFALGPLSEVVASTHTWAELAPHVGSGPAAGLAAHERVVRGEILPAPTSSLGPAPRDLAVLEVPLVLCDWEPDYALATYRVDGADFPAPLPPPLGPLDLPRPATARPCVVDDGSTLGALRALVEHWVVESDGVVEVVAVEGGAETAVAAMEADSEAGIRGVEVTPSAALAALAWAGASGCAHGRRRGAAVGRFGAWWTLAALAGLLDDWPVAPDRLGEAAAEMRWLWWQPVSWSGGWALHLAVADPVDGLAWAIAATDATDR